MSLPVRPPGGLRRAPHDSPVLAAPPSVAAGAKPRIDAVTAVLHPGDVVLGQQGTQLSTLLGSCVAIILTDPRRTVGVMSHVVHVNALVRANLNAATNATPNATTNATTKANAGTDGRDGRDGIAERIASSIAKRTSDGPTAMRQMAALLRAQGIEPRLCEAYIVGGGNMFPGVYSELHVGESNARWALQAVAELGASLLHHDLGGSSYRKLSWTVGPGQPQILAVPI